MMYNNTSADLASGIVTSNKLVSDWEWNDLWDEEYEEYPSNERIEEYPSNLPQKKCHTKRRTPRKYQKGTKAKSAWRREWEDVDAYDESFTYTAKPTAKDDAMDTYNAYFNAGSRGLSL